MGLALADGGHDEERSRRGAAAGPLAQARSPHGISTCAGSPAIHRCWARWTTLNDFFHLTDRPYETLRPGARSYQTPYLAQAVARRERRADRAAAPSPSAARRGWRRHGPSRRSRGRSRRPRPRAASRAGSSARSARARGIEDLIETSRHDEAVTRPARVEPVWSAALARGIAGTSARPDRRAARPGYLVINPLSVAAASGRDLARRGPRPASRRPATGRPVHRGRRLGRRRPAGSRLRLGP